MPTGPGVEDRIDRSSFDQLDDEELVDRFVSAGRTDRELAHLCFEVIISRYHWLISHIVRSSRYRFPAWDSTEDVIARVVFKVYRGLVQWRREGKLSSFIARIATSEMIDTMRRVGRDKSWTPGMAEDPESDMPSPVDKARSTDPSPEARLVAGEQREILDNLLAEVTRDWKDSIIINEYLIAGYGARELSEKYSLSEDVIYQRARRLKVRLAKWLSERDITSAEQLFRSSS